MNTKSRIESIVNAYSLDESITGIPAFHLSQLNLTAIPEFPLPTNVRLGHLAEKVVSELVKSSTNYDVLYENVQLIQDKNTVGEVDFILENVQTHEIIHLEVAYKFYLFDPSISSEPVYNWMGPNWNDSLIGKLEKLKTKQFPLLYHNCAKLLFRTIDIDQVSQRLCLMTSLFIPYNYKENFSSDIEKAIKGYYVNLETFINLDNATKTYYLPSKKEWGMDPSQNETWIDFYGAENQIKSSIDQKQALLCWQKQKDTYLAFFIVWW